MVAGVGTFGETLHGLAGAGEPIQHWLFSGFFLGFSTRSATISAICCGGKRAWTAAQRIAGSGGQRDKEEQNARSEPQ